MHINKRIGFYSLYYLLFIYATTPFMRNILNYLYKFFGKNYLSLFVNVSFIFALIIITRKIKSLDYLKIINFLLLIIIFIIIIFSIKIPEERIHFLEYGILGFLFFKTFNYKGLKQIVIICILILFAGAIDEIIQWFLPDRVGDLRDVAMNFAGGVMGIWIGKVYF